MYKLEIFDLNKHSSWQVSKLIYYTDERTFSKFFSKEEAIFNIEKLLKIPNNPVSHDRVYVVLDENNKILAMSSVKIYKNNSFLDEFLFVFKYLSFIDAIKMNIVLFLDYFVLSTFKDGDFYLAGIAVDESSRNMGLGSYLLEKMIKMAKNEGFKRFVLDVDLINNGALKLYKKLGFNVFNKKSIKIFKKERGMYNMELVFD